MIDGHDASIRVAQYTTCMLIALRMTVGDDAESLPEEAIMGGNHHLDAA